jgi:hypothetical protein
LHLAAIRHEYTLLDLSELDWYIERGTISYRYSTIIYDLGILKYGFFTSAAAFLLAVVTRNAFKVRDVPIGRKQ